MRRASDAEATYALEGEGPPGERELRVRLAALRAERGEDAVRRLMVFELRNGATVGRRLDVDRFLAQPGESLTRW